MIFTNIFASIPTRQNGDVVDATWWNFLQIAGAALESLAGPEYIIRTLFSMSNNNASPANVTGMTFDHTVVSTAKVHFEVKIETSTSELICNGYLTLIYRTRSTSWDIVETSDGDDTGVVFSVTSAGQVQYTSTAIGGSGYVGTIKFDAITFGV